MRHLGELARRGAGSANRETFDRKLDTLGASIEVHTERDITTISCLCLSRNLSPLIDLLIAMLSEPRMELGEHEKLIRETLASLDEVRDDDNALATRYFQRYYHPGHPYSRTAVGTTQSLAVIGIDAIRTAWCKFATMPNIFLGFAGDITPDHASVLRDKILSALPQQTPHQRPVVHERNPPQGNRLFLVEKQQRTQSQIVLGHVGLPYGTDDFIALSVAEAILGGMFTSRLVKEIRSERGWSYDIGCHLDRTLGPGAFRIFLTPTAERTMDALQLTLALFDDFTTKGATNDEFSFAQNYLTGSLPFGLATPQQRMRTAIRNAALGLPMDYSHNLGQKLATLTCEGVNKLVAKHFHPHRCTAVIVGARSLIPPMSNFQSTVVPFDEY